MAVRHLDSAIKSASEAGHLATLARLQAYKGNAWEDESLLVRAVENARTSGDKSTQARVAERCAGYFGRHGLFERSHEHIERIHIHTASSSQLQRPTGITSIAMSFVATT